MKNVKWLILCVLAVCVMFSGCGSVAEPVPQEVQESNVAEVEVKEEANLSNTFGSTVEFDGLEITFGTEIKWIAVGEDEAFGVPLVIKNVGAETNEFNVMFASFFGPNGTELNDVSWNAAIIEVGDSVSSSNKLRPGAESTSCLYVAYEGDGAYYVEFDNFKEKVEVELPIAK